MPIRPLLLLALASLAAPSHAQRPDLQTVIGRLTEADPDAVWRLERAVGGHDDAPDDYEIQLIKHGTSLRLIPTGKPSEVRNVLLITGPIDIDSAEGKRLLADGVAALAGASDIPAATIQRWVLANRESLRDGSYGEPLPLPGGRVYGNATKSDEGLSFWITAAWDEEEEPEPTSGIAKLEAFTKRAANWSTEKARAYQHSSGIRLTFDEDHLGPRMVFEYLPTDKQQDAMSAAVWLLMSTLGDGDKEVRDNHTKIVDWLTNPGPELFLHGASVKARDGEDGKVILTVRQSP